ncbi:MAG: S8 family serine peptidase [Thermoleophilia bacterium]
MTINTLWKKIFAGFVLIGLLVMGGAAVSWMTGGQTPSVTPEENIIAGRDAALGEQASDIINPVADPVTGATSAEELTRQRAAALPQPAKNDSRLDSSLVQLAQVAETGDLETAAAFADAHALRLKPGGVQVVVESAADESTAAIAAVTDSGGSVETTYRNRVQAVVPPENLKRLAASDAVTRVREPQRPVTSAVTSQGVADIAANTWQTAGYKGAGVKVAVIDPGFSGYTDRIASGDLPAGVITQSFVAGGDITTGGVHGTACAEIVYDIAPDAQLYLVNFDTPVELGNALDYIQSQGIQVVSSSWSYPASGAGDGSGSLNDAVAALTATGTLWVNASGNAAQMHWSGPFTDANHDNWLEFNGSDSINYFYASAGETVSIFLTWNKWPVTDQNYDLLLYQAGGLYSVAESNVVQTGSQEPVESFDYLVPTSGYYDVMVSNPLGKAAGDANMDLFVFSKNLHYQVAAGSLTGQPTDSADGLTVGAVEVGTTSLESFSSRGPTADGRIKPDLAGPDRVTTATYGVSGFGGTSAAAPHAAGAAALIREAHPEYSPYSTKNVLMGRATDLGATGPDNLYGSGKLNLGILPVAGSLDYFFSWYDQASAGMQDWVVLGNPSTTDTATADVLVGGEIQGEYTVTPGQVKTPQYPGVLNGPAQILSQGSKPMIASQRVLYNGNFTETASVPRADLAPEYYLPWYDENSPGMRSWILVSNQGTVSTTAEVYIHGVLKGTYPLAPGERVTPEFPGVLDGPVRVVNPDLQPMIVSERVTYRGSFSEIMGQPAATLKDDYRFAWYDYQSPGLKTWVLIANPGATSVDAEVNIGGDLKGTYTIPAGGVVTPVFEGVMAGPVRVKSPGGEPLITSERSTFGTSFEEVSGADATALTITSWFTWYDQFSPGMRTWLLLSNQGSVDTTADIYIDGTLQPGSPYTLPADGTVTVASFPGTINGPVKVVSGGEPLLVSERTIYNSSFNELTGIIP